MDLIIFIVSLSILVMVHELGHYLMARLAGIKVEEFGLGLPPKIFGKKIGETEYTVNALPIGGFVRLYGEDGAGKGGRAFNNKSPWQKFLVVIGGVAMNLILAIVIFSVVYGIMGIPTETDRVTILTVAAGSPAEKAGLKTDEQIESVGDVKITTAEQLTEEVGKFKGKTVNLRIRQAGTGLDLSVPVLVRENPPTGEGSMGVAISNTEMVAVPWWQFYRGIGAGFKEAFYWGKIILGGVLGMIGGVFQGHVPKDVSGPIGIYQITREIRQKMGPLAVAHFFGVISVNLAVVNILPFPALDGGRIIFVIYEMITKRKANPKWELTINSIGMYLLLALLLLITVGDVVRTVMK